MAETTLWMIWAVGMGKDSNQVERMGRKFR
jgi:hypothetical protein